MFTIDTYIHKFHNYLYIYIHVLYICTVGDPTLLLTLPQEQSHIPSQGYPCLQPSATPLRWLAHPARPSDRRPGSLRTLCSVKQQMER